MQGPRAAESTPLPRSLAQTLRDDQALATLALRMRRSQACLDAILPVVPPGLRPSLMAGPWDEQGWTLLTRQAAALTKLRQLQPHLHKALQDAGLTVQTLRLHALLPGSGR